MLCTIETRLLAFTFIAMLMTPIARNVTDVCHKIIVLIEIPRGLSTRN